MSLFHGSTIRLTFFALFYSSCFSCVLFFHFISFYFNFKSIDKTKSFNVLTDFCFCIRLTSNALYIICDVKLVKWMFYVLMSIVAPIIWICDAFEVWFGRFFFFLKKTIISESSNYIGAFGWRSDWLTRKTWHELVALNDLIAKMASSMNFDKRNSVREMLNSAFDHLSCENAFLNQNKKTKNKKSDTQLCPKATY